MARKLGASILNNWRIYPYTILRTMLGYERFNIEMSMLWSKFLSTGTHPLKLVLYSNCVGPWANLSIHILYSMLDYIWLDLYKPLLWSKYA